jgi:hypothetical protein
MKESRRFLLYAGLTLLSAIVTLYSYAGVVMNGHFALGPNGAQHLLAARIFVVPTVLGLGATLVFLVAAWRRRPRRKPQLHHDAGSVAGS